MIRFTQASTRSIISLFESFNRCKNDLLQSGTKNYSNTCFFRPATSHLVKSNSPANESLHHQERMNPTKSGRCIPIPMLVSSLVPSAYKKNGQQKNCPSRAGKEKRLHPQPEHVKPSMAWCALPLSPGAEGRSLGTRALSARAPRPRRRAPRLC